MVKSGLEQPEQHKIARVSPYRLATHLLSAFVIYGALFTTAMRCKPLPKLPVPPTLKSLITGVVHLLGFTVASGAFVAGCFLYFPLVSYSLFLHTPLVDLH